MAQLDNGLLLILIKAIGMTNAGIFAGYTWSLSRAAVPSILDFGTKDDAPMLAQWRNAYIDGAAFSRPASIISAISFGYLAYCAPSSSLARTLLIIAAVLNASGVPYALTLLRRTNGALSIRSQRLLGDYHAVGEKGPGQPMCITYASHERSALAREKDAKWTTRRLIEQWRLHNDVRTCTLILGTLVGAIGIVWS